jgi:hypothetical protein
MLNIIGNSIGFQKLGGFIGLLDLFPNAAAAYSLRKLRAAYSGSAVRVRRSVDNVEADFNPAEITDGTLLSWVKGVNLLLFSEQFDNPYYLANLGTITSNQTTAPDGSLTADLFTKTSGVNTVSEIQRSGLTYLSTGIHTYSIYVKQNVGDNVLIRLDLVGNTANATFNFSTKTISTVGANAINATATELSDGWFRLTLTGNVTSTAWSISIINLFINPTNDSVYVWGAQLNEGATAGDYVPTTSSIAGDGYVTTWYDQSGNSNNATQGTASAQPKIVSGGSLVTENGKAAVDFDGVDDLLQSPLSNLDVSNGISSFSVVSNYSAGAVFSLNSGASQTNDEFLLWDASSTQKIRYGRTPPAGIGFASTINHQLFTAIDDGNSLLSAFRNSSTTNSATSTTIVSPVNLLTIGARGIGSLQYSGKQQENIFYSSDKSANRTGIETNINTFYSIYP